MNAQWAERIDASFVCFLVIRYLFTWLATWLRSDDERWKAVRRFGGTFFSLSVCNTLA